MPRPAVCLICLGCAKNQVDAERVAGALLQEGFLLAAEPADADLALVATCAFLEPAREESRGVLEGLQRLKAAGRLKAVVALGCYPAKAARVPGADAAVRFQDYGRLPAVCRGLLGLPARRAAAEAPEVLGCSPRLRFGLKATACLKIAEGCANRCAYCAIPSIRGRLRSRPMADIVREARELAADGARELVLVAQDTAAYGQDLAPAPGSGRPGLAALMRRLLEVEGLRWLRLMYAHPAHLEDDVIELLAQPRVAPYLDLPIQHADDAVLAAMNRPYWAGDLRRLLERLRRRVPGIALRTTCMVGFPGESPAAFQRLLDFVGEAEFDHLGAFAYSREPGTPAARMGGQAGAGVKERRLAALMALQRRVSARLNRRRVGRRVEVLVERAGPSGAEGRAAFQAPEVDGKVLIEGPRAALAALRPGDFCEVEVTRGLAYDVAGRLL